MSKPVQPIIEALFSNGEVPPQGRPLDFEWRLIQRNRRPFLLLPVSTMDLRVSLELYSAQRKRARAWRAMIPLVFKTPAVAVFHKVNFQADAGSEIIRFLSQQSGVAAETIRAPAIKFGGMVFQKSRLVLLVCDATNRPVKVVKLGLDAEGCATIEREADLLEQLPANIIGCIRMTGRIATPKLSAFATSYFPGDSPEDDAGMETLFHAWLSTGPAVPVESLDGWRELEAEAGGADPGAWETFRAAMAGKTIRSTLHHGDFAPWNIRAVNLQNLRVFDWERGHLKGVPGWDWFHFIVQTSILARRHSVERVAAEVEELLQSPRFEKYAAAAGISQLVRPLVLGYLLHHRWVVKPLDGAKTTEELHHLLAARWRLDPRPQISIAENQPRAVPPGLWADARAQLNSAWSQLANVFWEPTLTANVQPPMRARFLAGWLAALLSCLWLAALADAQYHYLNHQTLLPLYAVPCLLATWKMGRRWGTLFAMVTALLGPVVAAIKNPAAHPVDIVCWNILMRFIIFQICVFLTDRIHRQKDFFRRLTGANPRPANFAENWVVVLASSLLFLIIAWGDIYTGPRVMFLPLYLFPAMLITLFLNLRWGTLVVLLASLNACVDEYRTKLNSDVAQVFGWNFVMRFLILFLVIWLLDRLRHENVLFPPRKQNGGLHES
jgi:hypothetical protein